MSSSRRPHAPAAWHQRVDARIAMGVVLIAGLALAAVLGSAGRLVTAASIERSRSDFAGARQAFDQLVARQTAFAGAQTRLAVDAPQFRALMQEDTGEDLAPTLAYLTGEFCSKLGATFCVVTDAAGTWIARSGDTLSPASLARPMATALTSVSAHTIVVEGGMYLVVSEPARFGRDEVIGTLTAGYRLDDAAARELAFITRCEVTFLCGTRVCGTSLGSAAEATLVEQLARDPGALGPTDAAPERRTLGPDTFVGGVYALQAASRDARLALLQDWSPAAHAVNQLYAVLAGIGALALGVSLVAGFAFSRRLTRPLRELSSAADEIAGGQWDRHVQVEGPVETRMLADAFNHMVSSIAHWREEAETRAKRLGETYDELRQAQKMEAVGRLAGGVAHDFNNLLTAILGYADLLLETLPADDPSRRQIVEIQKAGRSAASLTRGLLAFSRKQVLQPVVLNLNTVVTHSEHLLRRLIGEDVELVTTLEPSIAAVKADPAQIEQLLVNLAVNARDAMPGGGRLTIATVNIDEATVRQHAPGLTGPGVALVVRDTGVGMSDDVRAHIFEPFFTTKGPGHGTGLGLASVYGAVSQSGGHVWVESAPGQGSTFTVCLPAVAVPHAEAPAPPEAPATSLQGLETVLLVEDNDAVRELAKETLTGYGYTVIDAPNGKEALRMAAPILDRIALVVTDVVMPFMGGAELAVRLRTMRPQLKFIFASGYASDPVPGPPATSPDAAFLQKPFTPSALGRLVRQVLDGDKALAGRA